MMQEEAAWVRVPEKSASIFASYENVTASRHSRLLPVMVGSCLPHEDFSTPFHRVGVAVKDPDGRRGATVLHTGFVAFTAPFRPGPDSQHAVQAPRISCSQARRCLEVREYAVISGARTETGETQRGQGENRCRSELATDCPQAVGNAVHGGGSVEVWTMCGRARTNL